MLFCMLGTSTNRRTKWTDEELEALVHFLILKGFREKWPADRVGASSSLWTSVVETSVVEFLRANVCEGPC